MFLFKEVGRLLPRILAQDFPSLPCPPPCCPPGKPLSGQDPTTDMLSGKSKSVMKGIEIWSFPQSCPVTTALQFINLSKDPSQDPTPLSTSCLSVVRSTVGIRCVMDSLIVLILSKLQISLKPTLLQHSEAHYLTMRIFSEFADMVRKSLRYLQSNQLRSCSLFGQM